MPTDFATQPMEVHADFADIIRQESVRYEQPTQSALPRLINGKFDRLVMQSGLRTSPPAWLMLSVFCAAMLGGIAFLLTEHMIPMGCFALIGVFIPVVIANHLREKRQSAILEQLPDTIERLARLAQTGENLASSLKSAAIDAPSPSPLADEFNWMSGQIAGGTPVSNVLSVFAGRVGVPAASMLATVLKVHLETGSELSSPLFQLTDDVRLQLLQRERDRAIAADGQWPAAAVILVPLGISIMFLLTEPAAVTTVLDSVVGRVLLCAAAVSWCLGSIVVLRIVRQVSR